MKTLNEKQLKDINGGKGIVGEVTGEVTSIGNAISNGCWRHDLKQSVADTTK
jgi:bacteriocin-like protein